MLNEISVVENNEDGIFVTFTNGSKIYKFIFYEFINAKMYFTNNIPLCNTHAVKMNLNYYMSDKQCKYGHLPIRTVKGGKCYRCVEGKPKKHDGKMNFKSLTAIEIRRACRQMINNYPDIHINYETAVKYGFTFYNVYTSCSKGHKPFRYVNTNRCVECTTI